MDTSIVPSTSIKNKGDTNEHLLTAYNISINSYHLST